MRVFSFLGRMVLVGGPATLGVAFTAGFNLGYFGGRGVQGAAYYLSLWTLNLMDSLDD